MLEVFLPNYIKDCMYAMFVFILLLLFQAKYSPYILMIIYMLC